jgi:phosphatidylinositol kinase/protein kinase (PI-3  family)
MRQCADSGRMKTLFSMVPQSIGVISAQIDVISETVGHLAAKQEVRNKHALSVYKRVQNKLDGRDFNPDVILPIAAQVDKLIQQARSIENLCQHFPGWYVPRNS